jgi:isoleucyl-tRNA synthetase
VADVKSALASADGSALQRALETDGSIEVGGIRLTADEVEVRARRHESFALAEDGGWAVALDLELNDDLRREGVARELIRALNDLRKEQGLAIADRIRLRLSGDDAVQAAVDEHATWIADEVLAVDLEWAEGGDLAVRVDGSTVTVALERTT